jgi:FecR protein
MSERDSTTALASLGGPLAVPATEVLERQHSQVRPHLRQFVRGIPARRRREARQRRALVVGTFALSAALAVGVWLSRADKPIAFNVEQGRLASRGGQSDELFTSAAQGATLRTLRGVEVSVAINTRIGAITSDEHHEELELARGSVSLVVPKLGAGASFTVQTPDTKVTVHGTVFSVTVSSHGSTSQTCVEVSEGLVSVERAGKLVLVKGGETSNCAASPTPATALPVAVPDPVARAEAPPVVFAEPTRQSSSARAASPLSAPGAASPGVGRTADASLVAQNGLLAGALQAERAGRYREAQRELEALLERYPSSALRPDAERSLERVKRKLP